MEPQFSIQDHEEEEAEEPEDQYASEVEEVEEQEDRQSHRLRHQLLLRDYLACPHESHVQLCLHKKNRHLSQRKRLQEEGHRCEHGS